MTAPTDNPNTPMWHPETFSEPRTVPKNWDVSALLPPYQGGPGDLLPPYQGGPGGILGGSGPLLPPYQGGSGGILQSNDPEYHPDPFPEPRTFPTQWDVSELT